LGREYSSFTAVESDVSDDELAVEEEGVATDAAAVPMMVGMLMIQRCQNYS